MYLGLPSLSKNPRASSPFGDLLAWSPYELLASPCGRLSGSATAAQALSRARAMWADLATRAALKASTLAEDDIIATTIIAVAALDFTTLPAVPRLSRRALHML